MNLNLPRTPALAVVIALVAFSIRVDAQTNRTEATSSATNAVSGSTSESPAANGAAAAPAESAVASQPASSNGTPAATEQQTADSEKPPRAANQVNEEILKRLKELTDEFRNMRSELNQIEAERAAEAAQKAKPAGAPQPVPAPPPPVLKPAEQPKTEEQPAENEEQARIERERAIASVSRSLVLLPRGAWEVEPDFIYSHYSSNLINIEGFAVLPVLVLGQIQSLRIERDVLNPSLTVRYGLLDRLQLDANAGWRFEQDRFVQQIQSQPRTEQTIDDNGISDTQFGVSYQVLSEHGFVPDVTLSSRVNAPSAKSQFEIASTNSIPNELAMGSGVWSIRSGITATKSLDPVVLIVTFGYTTSLGRGFTAYTNATVVSSGVTNVVAVPVSTNFEPGDSYDYGVAVAMALNPVFAINLQVHQTITTGTHLAHFGSVQGSSLNEADFRFGFGWAVARNATVNFTAAAGLTEDSPDYTVLLALPIRF